MTKITLFFALSIAALCGPVSAQYAPQATMGQTGAAKDPCVLGANDQTGACVGPIRVAPMIMSQGPVDVQPIYETQNHPIYAPQPMAYTQAAMMPEPQIVPAPMAPPQGMAGCLAGYTGPRVPCNGIWVAAPSYAPDPITPPAPLYAPMPQYLPTPIYAPAPVYYPPQPQQIGLIPMSFFTGGITYGAGFSTGSTYSYGGGGFAFSSSGTRFSGVRERSPTHLIPPPPRPRHMPPPHHCC